MLKDLPNWPPQAAGAFNAKGGKFALLAEEVRIKDVVQVNKKQITFTCTLDANPVRYFYSAPDSKVAAQVAAILGKNEGMTLASIATIEIFTGSS